MQTIAAKRPAFAWFQPPPLRLKWDVLFAKRQTSLAHPTQHAQPECRNSDHSRCIATLPAQEQPRDCLAQSYPRDDKTITPPLDEGHSVWQTFLIAYRRSR